MKDSRAAVLMAILLTLLFGYLFQTQIESYFFPSQPGIVKAEPPLAGVTAIKSIKVKKNEAGIYMASVEYFYRGDGHYAFVSLNALADGTQKDNFFGGVNPAQRGEHVMDIEIRRPNDGDEVISKSLSANVVTDGRPSEPFKMDYVIEWPDLQTYYANQQLAHKSVDEIYAESVKLIDSESEDALAAAKKNLELILLKDPKYVAAYPELGRISMKSNWGPEGLRQAENYLLAGLAIDPHHANSKVLIGYVYAHQKRYADAEKALTEAAKIGTKNLWLWTNWGELRSMQNRSDEALEKYMKAIDANRTYDTYDRARIFAYTKAAEILDEKKQLDKLDSLYKKKALEFENYPYFYAEYGRFRLTHFGDYEAGISNSKTALEKGCDCEEAKYTLGMSYYISGYKHAGEEKTVALNQASVFLPEGPKMFYQMARFDETSKVIPQLMKDGAAIGVLDNQRMNALGYALSNGDVDAAKRLIKYGSRFTDLVGPQQYPVGLIPFSNQDIKLIKLMKANGVNFSTLKFNGMSAVEYAKRLQNQEIIDIVEKGKNYPI